MQLFLQKVAFAAVFAEQKLRGFANACGKTRGFKRGFRGFFLCPSGGKSRRSIAKFAQWFWPVVTIPAVRAL